MIITSLGEDGTSTTPIDGAGGTITIQHDGGPNNVDFIVGNSSITSSNGNGTFGSLSRGDVSTLSGDFPVLPNDGNATGTSTGITITSINTPPTISVTSPISLTVQENQPVIFTFGASTIDDNGDITTVEIDSILAGTLSRGGTVLTAGDTISVGEILTYTPPTDTTGSIDAFTVTATDSVSFSTPATVAFDITSTDPPICSFQCAPEPPGRPKVPTTPTPPTETKILDPAPIPENEFTDSFTSRLGISPTNPKTIEDARGIANNIEAATGVKPAFLYLSFSPIEITPNSVANKQLKTISNQEQNQLEIILVTGTSEPIRKRVTDTTQAEVLKVVREFRTQITAPKYRTRKTYLKPAQKLYNWIIKPIEADLENQGIKNLVFLSDAGLRSTPIAALHDGKQFLVEKYSVGLMPSLSLTNTIYTDLKKSQVLAMGVSQSTQGQDPLPAVPLEITTLINKLWSGKSLLDKQVTLDNFQSLRNQQSFGIIHLATHADFIADTVENSYIQLWESKLRFNQIRQLGLNDPPVEMLVLSACRSALGNEDAEIGFAGLAVLAGVKTSVASLWAVGDTGTAALMTKFYESLRTAPIRAEALRQAQVAIARGQVYLKDGKLQGLEQVNNLPLPQASIEDPDQSLAHPYYWSAFTMVVNPW